MTHEELLAKIGEPADEGYEYCDIIFNKALRAVAELHNPVGVICSWCTCHEDNHIVEYPCKTIRAIETALV